MKKIIFVGNVKKNLAADIQKSPFFKTGKKVYIVLGKDASGDESLLVASGFTRFCMPERSKLHREKFLSEYIDLIGHISSENNSLEWWATDIASKNRFTSRITFLLTQFLDIIEASRSFESGVLVVVNPDWTIVPAAEKACRDMGFTSSASRDFVKKRFFDSIACVLNRIACCIYSCAKIYMRCLYSRCLLYKQVRSYQKLNRDNYVIKTFVYDRSFSSGNVYNDAFFGSLPDKLRCKNDVLFLASILGNFRYCVDKIAGSNSVRIIPIEYFASIADLWEALTGFFCARIRVSVEKIFFGFDVSDIIKNELRRTFNGIQFYHLMHYWMVRRFARLFSTRSLVLTYENNPWEKMSILGMREISPRTRILGYQHTIVSQASANMFRSKYEKNVMPFPDMILTVGEAPRKVIERYSDIPPESIKAACGLRFEYLFSSEKFQRSNAGNILLALEGIKEVEAMVAYVLKQLDGKMQFQVRIRTHPVLPWAYFKKRGLSIEGKNNFSLSRNSPLKEDLAWADIVVYWGSTVALEALSLGRAVIHYRNNSLLSLDPLFECDDLKWNVSESDSLVKIIKSIYALDDREFSVRRSRATEYLKKYFLPVDEVGVDLFQEQALRTE
jgi:hypothetical protein